MTTLNEQLENESTKDSIDWNERYKETYPEDSPVMRELEQLKALPQNQDLTKEEKEMIIRYYQRHGKLRTLKQFDTITCSQLQEIKKERGVV